MTRSSPLRVALLLSTDYFEDFFGRGLGLTLEDYVDTYRNDWSWDYAYALRSGGAETTLCVPSLEHAGRWQAEPGIAVRMLPMGAIHRPWLRAPVLKRTPVGRFAAQAANTAAFVRGLRAALRADQIDALLVQEYWTARWDLLAATMDVPLIAIDQGLPDRREVKLLKRRSFPRAHRILTQTRSEAEKVARYGGVAERLPNGVDQEFFSPPAGEDRRDPHTVLITARLLDVQKRISDLIDAIALLGAPWRLKIVGSGLDDGMLRERGLRSGAGERIEFLGFVSDKAAIREQYRSCGVFALPSSYEGLPMSLLEAMSCGAAVVSSDIPAMAEVITDGEDGLLVPVGAPRALAAAIRRASERRVELGVAARRTIESTYARQIIGASLVRLVDNAVQPV